MPQKARLLNALHGVRRRLARALRLAPPAQRRLSPEALIAHAAALAAREAAPPGLWLSLLVEAPIAAPSAVAEVVVCDAGLADPAERWGDALRRARAPYVARLDPQGFLAPFAAERIAAALSLRPGAWALYTDEFFTDSGELALKPAFDPVLLDAYDYFGRLAVYARERVAALGGWTSDGPLGDWDLALRFAFAAPRSAILHLPYPAALGPERRLDPAAAAAALAARHRAQGRSIGFAAPLTLQRLRPVLAPEPRVWPKVSVVIPSRDAHDLLKVALAGLFEATDYPDFDVTVIDNGSTDPRVPALYAAQDPRRFRAEIAPAPFNFSRAVNRGAALTDAPLLLLLNNDIEVVEPGWLKEMASCFDYEGVGVVGAKLVYPSGALQHVGVIAGLAGLAGHWRIGEPDDLNAGRMRLAARQSLSAVTGAAMLVSRACFSALGGFDETTFQVAYNDVDFCLRARARGFRVIWTPFAKLVHHESATRGSDERPQHRQRFALEKAALRARHRTDTFQDPAYNPWSVRDHSDPWPTARPDLPGPRG